MPQDATQAAAALDLADRRLTAAMMALADADVVCLQEVYDAATLDFFHDHLMRHAGAPDYPWRYCFAGNDGGGRNLALMSRFEPERVASHATLVPADLGLEPPPGVAATVPVFRRDCLLAEIGGLSIFLCHFKAPWPDERAAWPVRRLEALAVRRLVERQFPHLGKGLWLIAGDLNEPRGASGGDSAIAPLTGEFAVDLLERLPQSERWSYFERSAGRYSRPDFLLASPELARRWPGAVPCILREGMSREASQDDGPRLTDVGQYRPHASDHAPLVVEFEGLAGAKPT